MEEGGRGRVNIMYKNVQFEEINKQMNSALSTETVISI